MDELTDRRAAAARQATGGPEALGAADQPGAGAGRGRLTFHVLEAPDAATAIVEFAQRTQVDHIVMGARGSSALRRYLGSVSSQVVARPTAP
jgi:nucleotide-binding universal stress UspA family protein